MNRIEHLLVILGEEASEVTKEAAKCLRFGADNHYEGKTNRERLSEEINDFLAVVEMLRESDLLSDKYWDMDAMDRKQAKVESLLNYSKKVGRYVSED